MACIELKQVSYRYPTSKTANLKEVNLTVESGEFIAVIGRNEAGKTTLCNVIRGFAPHFYQENICQGRFHHKDEIPPITRNCLCAFYTEAFFPNKTNNQGIK